MLRLAFSTSEPAAPSRRAAMLGYRVHIHKERAAKGAPLRPRASCCSAPKVCLCV